MKYIEFVGPPGVGKSTVHSRLISNNIFYGGIEENAIARKILGNMHKKCILSERLLLFIDEFMSTCFKHRYYYNALDEFISNNPEFLEQLTSAVHSVSHEQERIFSKGRSTAERYHLGKSTIDQNEILCLDEGFCQLVCSILWRNPGDPFCATEFLDCSPTPDLLILLDAPPDVCLNRQRERDRIVVSKEWEVDDLEAVQNRSRRICSEVCDLIEDVPVIMIENTGSIHESEEKIKKSIRRIE